MAKLFFRYGAMGSSKTANALMVEYNYRERGKKAVLAKPKTDTRDGRNIISSRIGLSSPCILVEELEQMPDEKIKGYDCVIVESFGVGGIPQRLMDAFAEELGDYDKTHKILILTTQVTYEGSDVGIYEVGKRVKNRFRFLEAHDMTIEAVVTKVMWLLAQNCENFDQLQQRFYRQINFDTFYH